MRLILDNVYDNELRTFLLSQDGIVDVNIVVQDFITEIDIKYNKSIIPKIIMDYINLYKKSEYPIMLGFDSKKNDDTKVLKYVVSDLCCEYCYKALVETLFDNDNICCLKSDFSLMKPARNIEFIIEYTTGITEEEIINLLNLESENK